MNKTIKNGDKVRDNVSGFTGIVTVSCTYLHGTPRYGVTSDSLSDGKPVTEYFDEAQLHVIS